MAQQVLQFTVAIPANTTPAAPVTIPLQVDNWDIQQIDLEVPAGASGLMGFAVYNNGVQWLPRTPGAWLIWDDRSQQFPTENQPSGSGWQIVGYNTGFYVHNVTVRFHVTPVDTSQYVNSPTINIVTNPTVSDPVVL
jgi:hypothetical protein